MEKLDTFSNGDSSVPSNPEMNTFSEGSYKNDIFHKASTEWCRKWFRNLSDEKKLDIFLQVTSKQWNFAQLLEGANLSCLDDKFIESSFFGIFVEVVNAIREDVFREQSQKYAKLLATPIEKKG
jgi:hypothetical protein